MGGEGGRNPKMGKGMMEEGEEVIEDEEQMILEGWMEGGKGLKMIPERIV